MAKSKVISLTFRPFLATFSIFEKGCGKKWHKSNCYSLKAMLNGAIFLATCNAILLLRDVN
jgi:hypothetical protein